MAASRRADVDAAVTELDFDKNTYQLEFSSGLEPSRRKAHWDSLKSNSRALLS